MNEYKDYQNMCKICGEQAVPSTEKAKVFVIVIKVLIFVQFGVAILDIVAHEKFLRQGIIGLLLPILLFVAFYKLSHQSMMIYTFMSLFFTIMFLIYIMQIVQTQEDVKKFTGQDLFFYVTAWVSLAFYLFTAIFSFYPYRQFKCIDFSENPEFAEFHIEEQNKEEKNKRESAQDFIYNDPEPLGYPMPDHKNEKEKKKKGSFQVFQGHGVKIG